MKKTFLTFACVVASITALPAQTPATPSFAWGTLLDSPTAGDIANALACDRDGNLYYLGTEGSKGAAVDLTYGTDVIGTGAEYSGTSYNYNALLVKTDKAGKLLWSVNSTQGECAANNGTVSVLGDGSVLVTLKIRPTEGAIDKGFIMKDVDGNEFKVEWPGVETRYYKGAVLRFSAEGKLTSSNVIEVSDAPQPGAAKNITDALDINCGAVNESDDVFVGVRYRNPITLRNADNGTTTLVPHNVVGWGGDSQESVGDMAILRFNNDGELTGSFTSASVIKESKMLSLCYDDGKLYALALVKGDNGQSIDVAGKTLTINEYASPLLISFNGDLSLDWCEVFPASTVESRNPVLQSCSVRVVNGYLWITGMFNGAYDIGRKTVASKKGTTPREGLLVKLSLRGEPLAATTSAADYGLTVPGTTANCITGYLDIFANPSENDKVYLFGYGMNAKVGVFVRCYNIDTLTSDPSIDSWNIITGGGAPIAQMMAYNPAESTLYVTARGNSRFTVMDGEAPTPTAGYGFGEMLAAFSMPFEKASNGVEQVTDNADESEAVYYNLQGMRVVEPVNGIYIRKCGSKVEKVVIR